MKKDTSKVPLCKRKQCQYNRVQLHENARSRDQWRAYTRKLESEVNELREYKKRNPENQARSMQLRVDAMRCLESVAQSLARVAVKETF